MNEKSISMEKLIKILLSNMTLMHEYNAIYRGIVTSL